MEGKVTLFLQALPGIRLLGEGKTEEGSIIALRRDGDEALYVPRTEEEKGMTWIPVGEFSVDPEAVTPVEFLEDGQNPDEGQVEQGEEATEQSIRTGPFGGRQLKRREVKG